jgi:drug efflux transport system permease protein
MSQLRALLRKEFLQIKRDPSSILIAFVLPLILLFIFGYGVNLDSNKIPVGVVMGAQNSHTISLAQAFTQSPFLAVRLGKDSREFEADLARGHLRGIIVIPQEFTLKSALEKLPAAVQVITDGSEPNIAIFVENYARGVMAVWLQHRAADQGLDTTMNLIQTEARFWFNPELKSRNFLLPGSIAIIMTLIGCLLTALVIAREWERGTMEAMMVTPISIVQLLLGKLIPYFVLGMGALFLCVAVTVGFYHVPFQGSFFVLTACSAVFLLAALGQGLLISSLAKDQFVASQMALISAFLPAFILSGFIFEIRAMPYAIQLLTYLFPARYFVTSLQTLFLAGTVGSLIVSCMSAMAVIAIFFFVLIALKTKKRLDA